MSELYEFNVWAEGVCTDADGNMLDPEGNIVEPQDNDEPEEKE